MTRIFTVWPITKGRRTSKTPRTFWAHDDHIYLQAAAMAERWRTTDKPNRA